MTLPRFHSERRARHRALWPGLALLALLTCAGVAAPPNHLVRTVQAVQPKMVKIFGAGRGGLEAYQSGLLVSGEGHILTVWSYVLDPETVTAILDDGRKYEARMIAADPHLEIALLKIEATDLDHFQLPRTLDARPGQRILAFSNLYGIATGAEPSSVMHGRIVAVASLAARRRSFEIPYNGRVLVLDAVTNNAGAPGGGLTDLDGNLLGLLGKELIDSANDVWLNYALPVDVLTTSVDRMLRGETAEAPSSNPRPLEPLTLQALGIMLVPRIVASTPPYIETVSEGSPAARAGLRSDDLIVMVNDRTVSSREDLIETLSKMDRIDTLTLLLQRTSRKRRALIQASLSAD